MEHWAQYNFLLNMNKGFTLIELLVVIAIIGVLSGIVLFSITQYINRGKDSNIAGNLAILVPAGEVYYNSKGGSYSGFCDPDKNSVIKNAILQMPLNPSGNCYDGLNNPAGLCCNVDSITENKWAACAREFTDAGSAYCVDSRGVKKEIDNSNCTNNITQCP